MQTVNFLLIAFLRSKLQIGINHTIQIFGKPVTNVFYFDKRDELTQIDKSSFGVAFAGRGNGS